MGRGKVRVFTKMGQAKYKCPQCDYTAFGEKQKELHFKYSHNLKYDGRERDMGACCNHCSKKLKNVLVIEMGEDIKIFLNFDFFKKSKFFRNYLQGRVSIPSS